MYALAENEDFDRQEIVTYEEVARLMPYPAVPRPIVLIGPPGVGRNELKRRLIALDPDKFRTTIPCEKYAFIYYYFPDIQLRHVLLFHQILHGCRNRVKPMESIIIFSIDSRWSAISTTVSLSNLVNTKEICTERPIEVSKKLSNWVTLAFSILTIRLIFKFIFLCVIISF